MASLTGSRVLFFTTSPRSPLKMVPEIELLGQQFTGKPWNSKTQEEFMQKLLEISAFQGEGWDKDLTFSARDRINRAPKALGFVKLKPTISLTEPGRLLINSRRKEEVILRQLLKFQLPSPYHTKSNTEANKFWVRPYLEILRLVRDFGSLTFDEIQIFGMQLIDYHQYDSIKNKITSFRIEKAINAGQYKKFVSKIIWDEILEIYSAEIDAGETSTRESSDASLRKFVSTKISNMRDYTDACFRYLRSTGVVTISQRGGSLSISSDKIDDVNYILSNVSRDPIHIDDEKAYQLILFNPNLPVLLTDNKEALVSQIQTIDNSTDIKVISKLQIPDLKSLLADKVDAKKSTIILDQINQIKDHKKYDDIMTVFDDISSKRLYDLPLYLEWNTWRGMTMLDGGDIKANLRFDDLGEPLSTAIGNQADIVADYGEFGLTIEVTLSTGQRQFETEGEPVSRHLAKYKQSIGKDAFCLFIAPVINPACITFFFMLNRTDIEYYGGKSKILPIDLSTFRKMLEDSYLSTFTPQPERIKSLFEYSASIALNASSENEWYEKVTNRALNWLA